jgi:hypothetical protein
MMSFTKRTATLALVALAGSAMAQEFNGGNLVLVVVNGTTGAAANVTLKEVTTAGVVVRDVNLPTMFTMSGSATSEGQLVRSGDNRFLTVTGYTAAAGTASIAGTTSATAPRTIARVGFDGTVNTSTSFDNVFSGSNIRSAFTQDGSGFWATGGNSGQVYGALGATSGTAISTTVLNTRVIKGRGSDLYFSTGSGTRGIYRIPGRPTEGTTAAELVVGTGSTSSVYDFYFADASTLYLADDRTTADGGVYKYVFDGSAWNLAYFGQAGTNVGMRSLAFMGGSIFGVTTSNRLVQFTDSGTGFTGFSELLAAEAGTNFRGLEMAPVPEPASMAALALGLGAVAARRRRRS